MLWYFLWWGGVGGSFASSERIATVQKQNPVFKCLLLSTECCVTFPTNEGTTEFPPHPVYITCR